MKATDTKQKTNKYFIHIPNGAIHKAVELNVGDCFSSTLEHNGERSNGLISRSLRCPYNVGDIIFVKEPCHYCEDAPMTCPHYPITDGYLSMDVRHDAGLLKEYSCEDIPLQACRIVLEITGIDLGFNSAKSLSFVYPTTFKILKNDYYQKRIDFFDLKKETNQSVLIPVKDGFDFTEMFEKARKTSAYKEQTMLCEWSDAVYNAMQKRKVDKAQLSHLTNIPYDKIVAVIKEEKSFTLEEYSKIAEALKCNFRLAVSYDKEE